MKTNKCRLSLMAATVLLTAIFLNSCGYIKWNGFGANTEAAETEGPESEPIESTTVTDLPPVSKNEPEDSQKARERLTSLYDCDLSMSSVIIATVDNSTVCPINTDGDPVLSARADCRRAVEEKYDTNIISKSYTSEALFDAAAEACNSDMYLADLMAIELSDVGAYHAAGMLANLYSLPHSDFTEEYFNASSVEAASFENGLYAVSGAASLNPDYLECIFFNKDTADAIGAADLYRTVSQGEWTIDKFGELAKVAAASGATGHGAVSGIDGFIKGAALSMGIDFVSNPREASPEINYLDTEFAERAHSAVDKLVSLLISDKSVSASKGDTLRTDFNTGGLMFLADSLYFSEQITDSSVNWGILPMPKLDSADPDYVSPMSDGAPVFCALINTPGYETSGLMLRALNAAAHEYTLKAYKNEFINYRLRNSGSIEMLDIICASAGTDFTHMYASGYSNLDDASYGALKKAVTTRTTLDAIYKQQKGAANRQLAASH